MQHIVMDSNKKGPKVLVLAGVHGDEYEPILCIHALRNQLPKYLDSGVVHLIPVVNPSAFENNTRVGLDGLDLARTCPGNPQGSITEQCAADVSTFIKQADYLIDLHTGGRILDMYPLAGYMLHANSEVLNKQRLMAQAFNLPLVWGTDAAPQGRTLSVARDANVPAIYVEYGGGDQVHATIVEAYTKGVLNVLQALGMLKEYLFESVSQQIVEDDKPNGGHLQSQMPAPQTGIFQAQISVGQQVDAQTIWGTITDGSTGAVETIKAPYAGMVLFKRANAFVRKGETLGGVISIDNRKHAAHE